jgi:atypical dual specificity phosphatase
MALLAYLLFYPTLWWNIVLCLIFPRRRWWDWIDDQVLLGALPFPKDVPRLKALGIGAVVNTCREYAGPLEAYKLAEIEQLRVPTVDFLPPSLADVRLGVAFMQQQLARGRKVYVHCKAGRGRSATIVLCYLVAKGLAPEDAQRLLRQKRPQVLPTLFKRKVVKDFTAGYRVGEHLGP